MKGYFSRLVEKTGIQFEPAIPAQNVYDNTLEINPDKDLMPIHEVEENKIIKPTSNVPENRYESTENVKTYSSSNLLPEGERYFHQKETRLEKYEHAEQIPSSITSADISLLDEKKEKNQDLKKNLNNISLKDSAEKKRSSHNGDLPFEIESISIRDSNNALHPKENALSKVAPLKSENFKNEILNSDRSENKIGPQIGLPTFLQVREWVSSETSIMENKAKPDSVSTSKAEGILSNVDKAIDNISSYPPPLESQRVEPEITNYQIDIGSINLTVETPPNMINRKNSNTVERRIPDSKGDNSRLKRHYLKV
jgi:hypothetical protein